MESCHAPQRFCCPAGLPGRSLGAGSAAQATRNRVSVGHPPPPGLVADENLTASVMGVRRLPLPSQGLGSDAGTGRAHEALGDPPHLDQARLVPIFNTPHDDLPVRPSPPVVVAADSGRQRRSAPTRHDAEARRPPPSPTAIAQGHAVSGAVSAPATQHHGQLRPRSTRPAPCPSGARRGVDSARPGSAPRSAPELTRRGQAGDLFQSCGSGVRAVGRRHAVALSPR
jgi:hypothetical protein